MNAITVEGIMFFSAAWLYWYWAEDIAEPLSFDGVPSLGNIALLSIPSTTELKGIAV